MLEKFESFFNILASITVIGGGLIISIEYFSKRAKMIRLLSKNLKRQIAIITPNNNSEYNMEHERRKIKECGFFNEPEYFSSYGNFFYKNNFGIVIIGYKEELVSDDILKTTLLKIRNNTPIIIYTYDSSNRIDFDINSITKNYLLVNYPLRLLGDIFSLMSVYRKD